MSKSEHLIIMTGISCSLKNVSLRVGKVLCKDRYEIKPIKTPTPPLIKGANLFSTPNPFLRVGVLILKNLN
jgi:hypothetical protein